MTIFNHIREMDDVAHNVLKKRYLHSNEATWKDVVDRVVPFIIDKNDPDYQNIYDMLLHRYFIPNSPTLVNSGQKNGGLIACFVVDFNDSIEEIYQTKLEFALIAKKGGGCGTTLSKLRPEDSVVNGSTHGYAGGPVKFFDTICHDMEVITQAGFREMAMMGTMRIDHPDILKFINAKSKEGRMRTTNISVTVNDKFMNAVMNDELYQTKFNGIKYEEMPAREIFKQIVDGAWKNGEPGILFYDRINNSPYAETGQEILATNPCGEQPLPPNGCCNLGSLDLSKFIINGEMDYQLFEKAIRLSMRFLDKVIDKNQYPTPAIETWAKENRPVGLGVMGLADLFLSKQIAYGSKKSLDEIDNIFSFFYNIALDESIKLGEKFGIPEQCQKLRIPRRNITVTTVAPTGTISIMAGCNSGIEPIFSEITTRKDTTGTYQLYHPDHDKEYFRCAVSSNGGKEVTWKEHILIQNQVSKYIDSGVSKTINFPTSTHRDTVFDAFMFAWELPYIKGLTIYRNGSREVEVLSPKNLKKDKCPICGGDLISESGCKHCISCDFSVCEIG